MDAENFSPLEIARYEISLRARAQTTLPPFLGSTLRGAFGHALKNTVCVMQHRDCERCMLVNRCIYPYLFETPVPHDVPQLRGQKNAPHPFILTPPLLIASPRRVWRAPGNPRAFRCEMESPVVDRRQFQTGDTLKFGLTLIGRAIEQLPYVVYAVGKMAERGLGAERKPFALVDVSSIDEAGERRMIYSSASGRFSPPERERRSLNELVQARLGRIGKPGSLKLRFVTPTRIRVQDDLQTDMSFQLLVRNLLRRISMLIAVHGRAKMEADFRGLIERAQSIEKRNEWLRWDDWERYSNRQRSSMRMGGFVGEIEYGGEAIKEYLPLIAAGELLHIGAGTSFGLGKFQIVA